MSAVLQSRTLTNTYNKMDNVLYEIHDTNGILRTKVYEPWKDEVLMDLLAAGFIQISGEKYVLTEEGREVINYDSFLYYNKMIQMEKVTGEEKKNKKFSSQNIGVLILIFGVLSVALIYTAIKMQWV